MERNFVSLFPEELCLKVFGYVDCVDLACCSGVARDWRRICEDGMLWKQKCATLQTQRGMVAPSVLLQRLIAGESWKRVFFRLTHRVAFYELAGDPYAAAVTARGQLWMWGSSGSYHFFQEFSLPDFSSSPQACAFDGEAVISASVGLIHFAAVTESGRVWTWGSGSHLGVWTEDVPLRAKSKDDVFNSDDRHVCTIFPHVLQGQIRFRSVSAGWFNTLAISEMGELYAWGSGDAACPRSSWPIPIRIENGAPVLSASRGFGHVVALMENGSVYSWGLGSHARLGHGDMNDCPKPRRIQSLEGTRCIAVSAGNETNAVVSDLGEVFTWGDGCYFRLGHKNQRDRLSPTRIESLWRGDIRILSVSCGLAHMAAVSVSGELYTWGLGAHGSLGLGHVIPTGVPTLVGALRGESVTAASAGTHFTLCFCDSGRAYSFGFGTEGRLGIGDSEGKSHADPVLVKIGEEEAVLGVV